jgi:putative hemolysin
LSDTGFVTSLAAVICLAAFSNWARLSLLSLRPARFRQLFGSPQTEDAERDSVHTLAVRPSPSDPISKAENLLLGALVANTAAKVAAPLLFAVWLTRRASGLAAGWAFALSFLAAVGCLLLFSELLPRIMVNSRPDPTMRLGLLPLRLLGIVVLPVTYALRRCSRLAARLLRRDVRSLAPWPLRASENLLWDTEGREAPLHEEEKVLISSIFDMTKTIVREVMVPRVDMHCLEQNRSLAEVCGEVSQTAHSRLPVYVNTLDNIVGLFLVKDLLRCSSPEQLAATKVKDAMHPIPFVPETKSVSELLREFQRTRRHMAVVVDEYGYTAGLVTIEDLLEEIVGEIQDEFDDDQKLFMKTKDGGFIVDAKMSIPDIAEETGIELPEDNQYDTMGGFVVTTLGKVPQQGDTFQANGIRVTVLEADDRRIHKVKLLPLFKKDRDSDREKGPKG